MKKFLFQSAIAAALLLAATSFTAGAQDNKLVYQKSNNPSIGIKVENASGATYVIKDKKGNVVLTGTVKDTKTFFLPTHKLGKGEYKFVMGSLILQEFAIV